MSKEPSSSDPLSQQSERRALGYAKGLSENWLKAFQDLERSHLRYSFILIILSALTATKLFPEEFPIFAWRLPTYQILGFLTLLTTSFMTVFKLELKSEGYRRAWSHLQNAIAYYEVHAVGVTAVVKAQEEGEKMIHRDRT